MESGEQEFNMAQMQVLVQVGRREKAGRSKECSQCRALWLILLQFKELHKRACVLLRRSLGITEY